MTILRPDNPRQSEELKGTKGCMLKHFVFCYNNRCPVHKEAKYGANYWPQELSPDQFRGTEEGDKQDRLYYGKDMHRNNQPKNQKNLYLNTDYNSFYNFNPEKETFSNTKIQELKVILHKPG